MKNSKLILASFLHAFAVVLYVLFVVVIMRNGSKIFGQVDNQVDNYSGPAAFLLLFVMSAAITGGLILGRSILWYFDGRKKEALQLFFYIVGWLFVFTLMTFILQIFR